MKENIPQYKVIDMLNQPVIGNFFKWEIMKTDKEQEFGRVESILKTQKKKGKKGYLIKWEGYSNKLSSWVSASDVLDVTSNLKKMSFYVIINSYKNLDYYPNNVPYKLKTHFA